MKNVRVITKKVDVSFSKKLNVKDLIKIYDANTMCQNNPDKYNSKCFNRSKIHEIPS